MSASPRPYLPGPAVPDVDEIWNGRPLADAREGPDEEEAADDTWRHPATLALTAFVLAVLSLFGVGLLQGATYVAPSTPCC